MEKLQTFQKGDVASFTALTGDSNPIHSDQDSALSRGKAVSQGLPVRAQQFFRHH